MSRLAHRIRINTRSLSRKLFGPFLLRRALSRIRSAPPGELPSRSTLNALLFAWGNRGWTADVEYLDAVCRVAATSTGPILECGSGLTTLLLGALTEGNRREVWSLEHHPQWRASTQKKLDRLGLKSVRLVLAPLEEFEGYAWYQVPEAGTPAQFLCVVCDGPPANTPGGRYGLFPAMKGRLAPGCTVLLDDADRPGERDTLDRWTREFGARFELNASAAGTHALVTTASTPPPH